MHHVATLGLLSCFLWTCLCQSSDGPARNGDAVSIKISNVPTETNYSTRSPVTRTSGPVEEPQLPSMKPDERQFVAEFRFKARLSMACDPTRAIVIRSGDGERLKFEVVGDELQVFRHRSNIGTLKRLVYTPSQLCLHLVFRTGTLAVTFSRVTQASADILGRLSCLSVATGIPNNLPPPPLYDRGAVGAAIATVISRMGDGIERDPDVPFECIGVRHIRLVKWEWPALSSRNGGEICWLHEPTEADAHFELASNNNEAKVQWIKALERKAVLLEAHSDVRLVPGSFKPVVYWKGTEDDTELNVSSRLSHIPIVVSAAVGAALIFFCAVVVVYYRRKRGVAAPERSAPRKDHPLTKQCLPSLSAQRRDVDWNPIDTLMMQKGGGSRLSSGMPKDSTHPASLVSEASEHSVVDRKVASPFPGGPVLARARAMGQPQFQARHKVDLVPGPGWESTLDGTDLSVSGSGFCTSTPSSGREANPEVSRSYPNSSGPSTEGEYFQ